MCAQLWPSAAKREGGGGAVSGSERACVPLPLRVNMGRGPPAPCRPAAPRRGPPRVSPERRRGPGTSADPERTGPKMAARPRPGPGPGPPPGGRGQSCRSGRRLRFLFLPMYLLPPPAVSLEVFCSGGAGRGARGGVGSPFWCVNVFGLAELRAHDPPERGRVWCGPPRKRNKLCKEFFPPQETFWFLAEERCTRSKIKG